MLGLTRGNMLGVKQMEIPDAGLVRVRILPKFPGTIGVDVIDNYEGASLEYEPGCPGVHSVLDSLAIDVPSDSEKIGDDSGPRWEQILKDMVLNLTYDEYSYRHLLAYLEKVLEESCSLLQQGFGSLAETRMVRSTDSLHLPKHLITQTLRILTAQGYESESVGRIETMEHVTLFVNGRMSTELIRDALKLVQCLSRLSAVNARMMLQLSSVETDTLINLIKSSWTGFEESQYRCQLQQLWDAGHQDLLQSIGFSKKRPIYGRYTDDVYRYTDSVTCRGMAEAILIVMQTFSRL